MNNNCSLFTSNFATARKLAEAVPFTKEGDHKKASNNRPLSLPPVLSKIYDKAVLAQFISYPGGGGTPIHYLYRYVPPNGVVVLKLLI